MSPIKSIVFVTTNDFAPTGGSEILWSRAAMVLARKGVDVAASVRHWKKRPRHIEELQQEGCPIFERSSPDTTSTRKLFRSKHTPTFYSWLRKIDPRIVVFSMGNCFENPGLIECCLDQKYAYVLLVQLVGEHNWIDQHTERFEAIYRGAQRCYFVSQANKDYLEKLLGIELPNGEIVQNPYTVPYDVPFSWPEGEDEFRLACVANLHALHKGQDLLFEVLRQDKWKKRPVTVDLYGDGPHKDVLQRLKNLWGLDNVHFKGFVSNIEQVWQEHQGLVMASRFEGMPLALIEAMLCGRVPIVTSVGGNPELVTDGVNGFLAQAPTAALLDEAMERAWKRRDEWKEIGRRTYKMIRTVVSSDPVRDFIERLRQLSDKVS